MLFPFFSLYITQKFSVGMTQEGIILGFFSSRHVGQRHWRRPDRPIWRRSLILFGLVFSAVTTLAFGLVTEFNMLFPPAVITSLLFDLAGPAHQAMIADILPEQQRPDDFGVLRVVVNMTWSIGPLAALLQPALSCLPYAICGWKSPLPPASGNASLSPANSK